MSAPSARTHRLADLHTRFTKLLPKIELHGRIYFRHVRCPHRKAELLQDMRSLGWKWFLRLNEQGKDVSQFVTSFIGFLARAVNSGRRITGLAKSNDVLNPMTQKRHGFTVEALPTSFSTSQESLYSKPSGQELHDAFEERLRDNTQTPVPDQAAFRIDWPAWMKTRTHRDRQIIDDLMAGERTLDVSRKYGISAARVSQLRQEFHDDWQRFCEEMPEATQPAVSVAA
jgi:hypothetical protein